MLSGMSVPGSRPLHARRTATRRRAAPVGGALTLGALLGVLLGACAPPAPDLAPSPTVTAAPAATAAAQPTPDPAAPAPAEPVPATRGSRENPATPGVDTVALGEAGAPVWEVLLSAADFAADDVVASYYEGNEPPPEGSTYVLVPVTATYRGAGAGEAWLDLDVAFVAADGRVFTPADALVPGDFMVTPDVPSGGTVEGDLVFALPDDALTGGVWSVVDESATEMVPAYFTAL